LFYVYDSFETQNLETGPADHDMPNLVKIGKVSLLFVGYPFPVCFTAARDWNEGTLVVMWINLLYFLIYHLTKSVITHPVTQLGSI